jgi:hypothetical protein
LKKIKRALERLNITMWIVERLNQRLFFDSTKAVRVFLSGLTIYENEQEIKVYPDAASETGMEFYNRTAHEV